MTMTGFVPKVFTNRDGEVFETKPHFATFNEIHNASRSKVYIILYHRLYKLGKTNGLTLGELHRASGVDYDYLKTRLAKWVSWGYLQKHLVTSQGKPCYSYSIAERGKHFVEDILPREWLNQYVSEIRQLRGCPLNRPGF